jgi:hypothetical protein
VDPVALMELPRAQGVQAMDASVAAKVPRGHGVHTAAPATAAKVPRGQGEHCNALAKENRPTGQGTGAVDPVGQ